MWKWWTTTIACFLLCDGVTEAAVNHPPGEFHQIPGVVVGLPTVASRFDFATTLRKLVGLIDSGGNFTLVHTIDHAAAADAVDRTLAPMRVLVLGNLQLKRTVLGRNIYAGLDLPLKMMVFEDDGTTFIAYNSLEYLSERYGLSMVGTVYEKELQSMAETAADNTISVNANHNVHSVAHAPGLFHVHAPDNNSFETTWKKLLDRIEASPASIAFTVDYRHHPKARLVVFGDPHLGTPLMQNAPTVGIDLPLKILVVADEDGSVTLVTNRIKFVQRRHGLDDDDLEDTLEALRTDIRNLMGVSTSPNHTCEPSPPMCTPHTQDPSAPHTHEPSAPQSPHTHEPSTPLAPHTHAPSAMIMPFPAPVASPMTVPAPVAPPMPAPSPVASTTTAPVVASTGKRTIDSCFLGYWSLWLYICWVNI